MILELDPEIKDFLRIGNAKKINTGVPSKRKNRNHFTAGDTGFVPQSAGQNPYSSHWR